MNDVVSPPSKPWQSIVLTLFPEMFPGTLQYSLAGKALQQKIWSIETMNIRDFAVNRHRSVDDTPFGGGAGMVMRADIVDSALQEARRQAPHLPLIYLTPRGQRLTQKIVADIAKTPGAIILCGRYEAVDERLLEEWQPQEISLGDFVLSGGEPAAIALLEACIRLLPGVLGQPESLTEESFSAGLLEYPQYTKPAIWKDRGVPDVLLSGNHQRIKAWRQKQAEEITKKRRPDLWQDYKGTVDGK